MADSIAGAPDSVLIDIANQCFNVMDANLGNYPGVTQAQIDELKTRNNVFTPDVAAHVAADAAKLAATQTKKASRDPVEEQLRLLRNIAKANGASEAAIAAMGIPSGDASAPSTATVPAASVNTSERLRHTISWTDAAALDNKRKPRGAMGCEIWSKIGGAPPTDEGDCTFLTLDASTPYLVEYDGAQAGQMAHYMFRWRMRDGSTSALGETVSATITG